MHNHGDDLQRVKMSFIASSISNLLIGTRVNISINVHVSTIKY